ncbi:hypothetical protein C0J27_00535 [Candidatus Chromulinivorax destructor]|uniref:Uncharacterized protein n=1 Tax=Candidatus Chromulinivorax destructor TaxID=2066483 RepID=A0A345ZAC1_9BACT|nr:hypothetical protein C0J27_00535 [Candidatus Chromulinivorax destructor]
MNKVPTIFILFLHELNTLAADNPMLFVYYDKFALYAMLFILNKNPTLLTDCAMQVIMNKINILSVN